MDLDEARAVIAEQHHVVLTTLRRDGTPQMSPVLATLDGEGRVVVSSRHGAFKVRNLRRDPRAWLCVLSDDFYGRWIQVAGSVRIVELPEAMDGLVDYYRRISGEHPDWDDYRAAMVNDERLVLRLRVERVIGVVQ
jgi:PPOX class probable F420-dependent enzyme